MVAMNASGLDRLSGGRAAEKVGEAPEGWERVESPQSPSLGQQLREGDGRGKGAARGGSGPGCPSTF